MPLRTRFLPVRSLCLFLIVFGLMQVSPSSAQNQNRNNRANNQQNNNTQPPPQANRNADLKKIDLKASKVQDDFVREAVGLAQDYEKAGDLERSIQLLEAVLKVNPDLNVVKQKIEELRDEVLSANEYDISIDADGTWGKPLGYVREGRPLRIKATGTYRFSASMTTGPEGFPEGDVQKEMLGGIPCGSLAGLIVKRGGEPGEPFAVGKATDLEPDESGFLYLKVNVPPGSSCSGKLKINLSGYILSPDLDNIGSNKK